MTRVTDHEINMHPLLIKKLDLMIHRMEEKGFDNCLLIDGKEGFGKTTLGSQICYYVHYKTGRRFNHEDIYFRVKSLLEEMKKDSGRIFLLDEAELDLLSEQRGKMQRYFMQMLMAARKKNHFIVVIIPTIKKLKPFVIERAIGFMRVYSPDNLKRGFYAYYNENAKNRLHENFMKTRRIEYKKFYTFNGTFPNKFKEFIDEESYDKKKDEAIASIGSEDEKESKQTKKMKEIMGKVHELAAYLKKKYNIDMKEIAEQMQISNVTLSRWSYEEPISVNT